MIAAVKDVLKHCDDVLDVDRVFYAGGSHGGFLGLHFALSCSEICKAVAIRNPVTNLASMYGTSDIADWTMVEALGMSIDPRAVPSADQIKQMWNCLTNLEISSHSCSSSFISFETQFEDVD